MVTGAALRIDKLLWYLRLSKSRNLAQNLLAQGHVRINGNRVPRSSLPVHVGDIISLPHGEGVMVIRIITLPDRRGPAAEAQRHFVSL